MARDPLSRHPIRDMFRVIGMQCTFAKLEEIAAAGQLFTGEITSVSTYLRLFLQGKLVAPYWHPDVNSEAEMLAIHNTSERGAFRADKVWRTDTYSGRGSLWEVRGLRGLTIEDWFEHTPRPATEGEIGDSSVGHWEPATNGDPADPQLSFSIDGDVVMGWVED